MLIRGISVLTPLTPPSNPLSFLIGSALIKKGAIKPLSASKVVLN